MNEYTPPQDFSNWRVNLFFIWLGEIIAITANSFYVPFLPIFIQEKFGIIGDEAAGRWMSIYQMVGMTSFCIFAPIWGYIADRFGRKIMLLRAYYISAFLFPLIYFAPNIYCFIGFRFLASIFSGTMAAAITLVVTNTPNEKQGLSLGFLATAAATGHMVGYFFGAQIYNNFGSFWSFMSTGILYLIGAVGVTFFVKEKFRAPAKKKKKNDWSLFAQLPLCSIFLLVLFLFIGIIIRLHDPYISLLVKAVDKTGITAKCEEIQLPADSKIDAAPLKRVNASNLELAYTQKMLAKEINRQENGKLGRLSSELLKKLNCGKLEKLLGKKVDLPAVQADTSKALEPKLEEFKNAMNEAAATPENQENADKYQKAGESYANAVKNSPVYLSYKSTVVSRTGWVSLFTAVGGLISGLMIGKLTDKFSARRVVAPAALLAAIGIGCQYWLSDYNLFAALSFGYFVFAGGLYPAIQAFTSKVTPPDIKGIVFGFGSSLYMFGSVLAGGVSYLVFFFTDAKGLLLVSAAMYLCIVPSILYAVYIQKRTGVNPESAGQSGDNK